MKGLWTAGSPDESDDLGGRDAGYLFRGISFIDVIMHIVVFKNAFHLVYMPVFSLAGHTCDAAEVMGMIAVGRDAVIKMNMEAAKADHPACIPKQSVVMAV